MLGLVVLYLTEWNLFVLICQEEKDLELQSNSMPPIVLIIILSLLLIPNGTIFLLYVWKSDMVYCCLKAIYAKSWEFNLAHLGKTIIFLPAFFFFYLQNCF